MIFSLTNQSKLIKNSCKKKTIFTVDFSSVSKEADASQFSLNVLNQERMNEEASNYPRTWWHPEPISSSSLASLRGGSLGAKILSHARAMQAALEVPRSLIEVPKWLPFPPLVPSVSFDYLQVLLWTKY